MIGNPADLSLVRFQADDTLPLNERRNYKHVFDAMGRIIKEEGFFSLWKGAASNCLRAMSINLGKRDNY
jgi:solute carrier family 25 oxoglutarate transporter 11